MISAAVCLGERVSLLVRPTLGAKLPVGFGAASSQAAFAEIDSMADLTSALMRSLAKQARLYGLPQQHRRMTIRRPL